MITLDVLKSIFGEESGGVHFSYLNDKNEGGKNNAKGNTFENFFSVYVIAKFFNENADGESTLFSSQIIAFVDDLVVREMKKSRELYFQIKDVAELSWHNGKHKLKDDFWNQNEILCELGVTSELLLVVSRKSVYEDLVSKLPIEIKDFVKVLHFESASSMNSLLRMNSIMKDELRKMCALSNPSIDKLETLGTILLGSWDATDKNNVTLGLLINNSCKINPNFIKGGFEVISDKLDNIFKSIDGFAYKVENGFIKWKYNNTDKGIVQYGIGSSEFEQWENDIFNEEIRTFEDLEPFLSA